MLANQKLNEYREFSANLYFSGRPNIASVILDLVDEVERLREQVLYLRGGLELAE